MKTRSASTLTIAILMTTMMACTGGIQKPFEQDSPQAHDEMVTDGNAAQAEAIDNEEVAPANEASPDNDASPDIVTPPENPASEEAPTELATEEEQVPADAPQDDSNQVIEQVLPAAA